MVRISPGTMTVGAIVSVHNCCHADSNQNENFRNAHGAHSMVTL